MLKQVFDRDAIAKSLSKRDVWKWSLWDNRADYEERLNDLVKTIELKDREVSPFAEFTHKRKKTYQASNAEDVISIRLLDRSLRRLYKIKQPDRNKIVCQIKSLLKDTSDLSVIRLDIDGCYENINFESLIERIERDMLLSPDNLKLLKSIGEMCITQKIEGVPRGISISPTLTEIYLEQVDNKIRGMEGVAYYSRYVDDFFMIVKSDLSKQVISLIEELLKEISLALNYEGEKHFVGAVRDVDFTYLGYRFSTESRRKKPNKVELSISDHKIKRICTKIALAFSQYKKDQDFSMLNQRINYLASLRIIKEHENGNLLGGIAYSYQYVTDGFDSLRQVDGFYNSLIGSSQIADSAKIKKLREKSFFGSVRANKKAIFTKTKAKYITRVWKHV